MSKKVLKEMREKATGALVMELQEKQRHLYDLRSQAVTEKLEDPSQISKVRRDIARIKTIQAERLRQQKPAEAQTKSA